MSEVKIDTTDLQTAALFHVIKAGQQLYVAVAQAYGAGSIPGPLRDVARQFDEAIDCAILLDAYEGHPDRILAERIKMVRLYECGYRAGRRMPAYIGDDETPWQTIGRHDCRKSELEVNDQARQVWLVGFHAGQDIARDEE